MISCQRCGQPLSPNTATCPRCGAPASPSAGWSQPQPQSMGSNAFGAPSSSPYGAPPSPSLSFGASQQPPRFSAGSLISDSDLPDWLRAGPGGQGAQPAQAPVAAQSPQAPWGAPAQPAQVQGWPSSPAPRQPEIDAQHTIRQPAFGAPAPAAQPTPFGQPQQGYAQQPYGQPGLPSPYAQPPASFGQPSRQSGYGQPSYPQQMGQPQQPAGYPQQPAYGQQPASYPQAPASGNYGGFPAFAPQQVVQVNAFPSIEQAGSAYNGPQVGGMAGHALLDQRSLPNWLAGGAAQPGAGQAASRPQTPSGMQARSLVDDQALPKWLRDQPDDAGQANASAWIGAPAAHEPMRPALNEAYAQSQVARPPQPGSFGAPAAPAQNAFGASSLYQPPSPMRGDEAAMPDWLRAQAGNAPANAAAQGGAFASAQMDQQPSVGFAASDLIDPAALPDWVTGRAPAAPTFSSTQGWSVAQPEPDASYAAVEYHGGEQGFGQSYQQDYGQGYGQDGYDQQPEDSAYGGEESAQGVTWENAAWGESEAQDVSAYNLPPSPQKPLAPEELPPWLRGKGGAAADPRAADPRAAAPARNPWANAASPVDSIDGWNDDEPWDDGDDQSGQQRWDAAPTGRDNRAGSAGYGQQQMTGWNDAESSMDWGEPAHARTRDPYDQYSQYGQREPRAAAGYADDLYGRGYDQMAGDYGDYGEYDDEYEDDEAQSARKGGRGWLGFLRRDKR